jgi:hypothetical protein
MPTPSPTADVITVRNAVATAITNAITAGPVYGPITAVEQIYETITKLVTLQKVTSRIVVMPSDRDSKLLNRALKKTRTIKIDVAVQAMVGAGASATAIDPYLNQAIAMADLLVGFNIPGLTPPAVALVKEAEHVLFVPQQITEYGVFTSIIHLTIEYAG